MQDERYRAPLARLEEGALSNTELVGPNTPMRIIAWATAFIFLCASALFVSPLRQIDGHTVSRKGAPLPIEFLENLDLRIYWHAFTVSAILIAVFAQRRSFITKTFQRAAWGLLPFLWAGAFFFASPFAEVYSEIAFAIQPPMYLILATYLAFILAIALFFHFRKNKGPGCSQ